MKILMRTLAAAAITIGLTIGIGPWIAVGPPHGLTNTITAGLVTFIALGCIAAGIALWTGEDT